MLENILDLTHIDFVHGHYSGSSDADEDNISFESTSETVTMIRTIRNKPTSVYQRDVLGVTVARRDQKAFTHVFICSGAQRAKPSWFPFGRPRSRVAVTPTSRRRIRSRGNRPLATFPTAALIWVGHQRLVGT